MPLYEFVFKQNGTRDKIRVTDHDELEVGDHVVTEDGAWNVVSTDLVCSFGYLIEQMVCTPSTVEEPSLRG
jgi:hypothetical protein